MPPEEKTEEPKTDMTEDAGMKIEDSADIEPKAEKSEAQESEVAKEPTAQEHIEEPVVVEPPVPPQLEAPADKTEDGGLKTEDSTPLSEPTLEILQDVPKPAPTPEETVNPENTTPEDDTPPVAPIETPTPPVAPASPAFHDPKYVKGIPQKILDLSPEELNAARLLWAREHIAAAQAQGNRNRRARMNNRMDEIESIIRAHPKTTTHVVATKMNLSDKTTSGYLQKLVHAGRVQASGNSRNRRYYV